MATRKQSTAKRKRNGLVLGRDMNKREGQRGYVYAIWDGKRHDFTNVAARSKAVAYLQEEKSGPRRSPKKNPGKWVPFLSYSCRKYAAAVKKQLAARKIPSTLKAGTGRNAGKAAVFIRETSAAAANAASSAILSTARRSNPCKKVARKRNGSELASAAKMYRKFHGKAPAGIKTVQQLRVTPSVLADCGRLVEIIVATDVGKGVKLSFGKGVRVATTGDGGQLYFVGGDQAVNLRQFPNVSLPKDQVELGECVSICYHTSKDFHNFEPSDYEHQFGEEGGARPMLAYDFHSQRLYFVGGDYIVKREGIVD